MFQLVPLPYRQDNVTPLAADNSPDYIVEDIEVVDTVSVHRVVVRTVQVDHRVAVDIVEGIALVVEQKADYHIPHRSVYPEHFVCHRRYKRLVQRQAEIQERSYSVHNEYKMPYLTERLDDMLDKVVS